MENDYRLYLEEKFKGFGLLVNSQYKSIDDKLTDIKEQTTKTNSRVNKLEDAINLLELKVQEHPLECTQAKKLEKLSEDLIEYKVFKKYPKLTIFAIGLIFITILVNAIGTIKTIGNSFKSKEIIERVHSVQQSINN